ncbi:MAG: aminopeptidase P family protein [Helicobacteraceae bacterium]|jgi:Xaa-Pro aminopeptidase|nr:aminopeptidase P family protein [Helicobacteraceae bacterium]
MSGFITINEAAQRHECGFSCDHALFVSANDERYFITDSRYTTEARERAKNVSVIESDNLFKTAKDLLKKLKGVRVKVDPREICYADLAFLLENLPKSRFVFARNFHQKKRAVKSADEVAKIEKSVRILAQKYDSIAKFIAENGIGLSEKKLHYLVCETLRNNGENDLSFEPIFAIEENAAKPHALPGDRALKEGDTILLDCGVKYDGYCSDRTRAAIYDRGFNFDIRQKFNNAEKQKIYDVVLGAHNKAIDLIKSGMRAKEIDLIARNYIANAGYGKYFSHSLGHGVGLEIHEEPYINKKNDMIIENNMVFTIEPGIYIPGFFGIRIENIVKIQDNRAVII